MPARPSRLALAAAAIVTVVLAFGAAPAFASDRVSERDLTSLDDDQSAATTTPAACVGCAQSSADSHSGREKPRGEGHVVAHHGSPPDDHVRPPDDHVPPPDDCEPPAPP